MPEPHAWELYQYCFMEGDWVVIVTDEDDFDMGTLRTTENGCYLSLHFRKTDHYYPWERIIFMAHDGFPVRKLMGADGSSKLYKEIRQRSHEDAIRYSLIGRSVKYAARIVFGDPFAIEGVSARLFHAGNSGPKHWDEWDQEVLYMRSQDGAAGLLYELDYTTGAILKPGTPEWAPEAV